MCRIWSIISKFQIVSHLEDGSHHGSAKELLLEWINSKITSMEVTNFKNDWHDGVLLQELTNKIGEDIYGAGTTLCVLVFRLLPSALDSPTSRCRFIGLVIFYRVLNAVRICSHPF